MPPEGWRGAQGPRIGLLSTRVSTLLSVLHCDKERVAKLQKKFEGKGTGLILIDGNGKRVWCDVHRTLHREKYCPKCAAWRREIYRRSMASLGKQEKKIRRTV